LAGKIRVATRTGWQGRDTIEWDLGDVVASFNLHVKGTQRFGFRLRVGAPVDTTEDERNTSSSSRPFHGNRKAQWIMDLQSDKKVTLSGEWTDENGNPTDTPADANIQYTTDSPGVIHLTDNGDGTAEAVASGVLGVANIHADATSGGKTLSGDLTINVVAGMAERFNIVASEPEETTPDEENPEPTPEPTPEPQP
jgi:hypothetical protein